MNGRGELIWLKAGALLTLIVQRQGYEMTQANNYREHYLQINDTYPSVFALKTFIGNNPYLKQDKSSLIGQKICDVGFGDGRDLNLFSDLGMSVFGVEPDQKVVEHTQNKMLKKGTNVSVKVGTNIATGYPDIFFDYVYASGSIYYLPSEDFTIIDALTEAYRILNTNGKFLATFARSDSHATKKAEKIDKNTLILKDSYYNFREGQRYHVYNEKEEIKKDLELSGFKLIYLGDYDVDWFGTRETLFLCYAIKT